ncbi:MAG: phosphotransferase [Candidatus Omnitrophica bacterium]|nr:phosphotransferase [Candidatus Omnitrophota bacterium]
MNQDFVQTILEATGASAADESEMIQELWSGYGTIKRYCLEGSVFSSVIVKHVNLPDGRKHPRGWDTDFSHKRKVRSYEVEKTWYRGLSAQCGERCRVPRCLAVKTRKQESLLVLEDLDAAGFAGRKRSLTPNAMSGCLKWLAYFHATFLGVQPDNLWKIGTYWHLDTRPDELKVLTDKPLREAAPEIDRLLNSSPFRTLVHGDAKLANFCFSKDPDIVAAVDFQYTGGGCGMKDVAYYIGSCLNENECEVWEKRLLDTYFTFLEEAVLHLKKSVDIPALIENWRSLYPVAWTDFHRFIKGWSPGHWKINSYSERIAKKVIGSL